MFLYKVFHPNPDTVKARLTIGEGRRKKKTKYLFPLFQSSTLVGGQEKKKGKNSINSEKASLEVFQEQSFKH